MNGVILYQSKYGATRKYAQWLFAATNFDLLEMKQAKGTDLSRYEVIVFGGGIYASGIAGLNALKKQLAHLSPQKVVIFCVGGCNKGTQYGWSAEGLAAVLLPWRVGHASHVLHRQESVQDAEKSHCKKRPLVLRTMGTCLDGSR